MDWLTQTSTHALVALLDIGIGALIVSVLALWFNIDLEPWHLLLGGFLAILPDTDLFYSILVNGTTYNHHTTLMHRPLFLIPIATVVALVIGGNFWAITTLCCVTWHFLHDTPPLSHGRIAWLWPFTSSSIDWIHGFRSVDSVNSNTQHGINQWRKPTTKSVTEIVVGMLAFSFALYLTNVSLKQILLCVIVVGIGVSLVWQLNYSMYRS